MNDRPSFSTLRQMPLGIWVLGFVSMLMDISSEMIHSLLPLFMVGVLGASTITVGLIEGLGESIALVVKVFSGTMSDYFGRRKGLALLGYTLGALTKPLFAIADTIGIVVTARVLDRMGKGIRGAPRDALVADIALPHLRGAAFGLRQSLDTVGAFLGPLIAVGLMLLWANNFRMIFWVAVIPGVLAVMLLLTGVREPQRPSVGVRVNPIRRENMKRLNASYWWVVGIGAAFTLARFSEALLVLRAHQVGIPLALVPLVMVAMNAVYAASAYPFGKLSDRVRHSSLLAFGLGMLIAADLVMATSTHCVGVLVGVLLWGVHMGATQGLLATMVTNAVPVDLLKSTSPPEHLTLDDYLIDEPNRTSLHRVRGTAACRGRGIVDGDLLAVERGSPAAPADIVVAIVDGELTVKTHRRDNRGKFYLEAAHPDFPEVRPRTSLELLGVVVSLARRIRT